MNELHNDTQAIAARLTAIAERLKLYSDFEIGGRAMITLPQAEHVFNELFHDLSAHVETLTQQVAELTAERDSSVKQHREMKQQLEHRTLVYGATVKRAEQAEQQRDAAHAALKKAKEYQEAVLEVRQEKGEHISESAAMRLRKADDALITANLDAALAASAPQKAHD